MTTAQKIIKYLALAFAIFLIINIFSVMLFGLYGLGKISGLNNSKCNNGDSITDDLKLISDDVTEISTLKIELGFTNLEIKESDTFKVETNNNKIDYLNDNGDILIKEDDEHIWLSKNNKYMSTVIVYMPEDMIAVDEVKIENGAGSVHINELNARKFTIKNRSWRSMC